MRPGQDWWKIYPWSPYNAWRNPYWYPPYNPNYPFPPNEAYGPGSALPPGYVPPTYVPSVVPVPERTIPDYQPAIERKEETRLPHPTGEVKVAPANAAVIRVEVPDRLATVLFDGQKVSSVGTTRYYVTPTLQGGKGQQYTVSTVINQDGRQTTVERKVDVTAGQIVGVNFTR
jgi:uncharacterized protein (TIGR03000 family)